MNAYTVIFDQLSHLGPGDPGTTRHIVERLRSDLPPAPRIADFGCGVGASTLVLAQCLPGSRVLGLDIHAPFIERLETEASKLGLDDRISAVVGDMASPPPLDDIAGKFDLIWAESAIYNLGRARAFASWLPLLNPNGWLVFSDIVWQSEPTARSKKVSTFWANEYPEMTTAADVVNELATAGFKPLEPVLTDRKAWSNYYEPLRERLGLLTQQDDHSQALSTLITELEQEIEVYDCTENEVALAFFLAQCDSITE